MTREQSKRNNYLKRVLTIQGIYLAKRKAFHEEWGWYPTKKKIWQKFIYPVHNISYYTFIEQINIDVEEERKKLESKINEAKKESDMKKKQLPLFGLLITMFIISSCSLFKPCLDETELATYCAETYPCNDSLTVDTIYDGAILEIPDFDTLFIDTTVCPPTDLPLTLTDTVKLRVPGRRIYVPYTVIDSTWWRIDSALSTSLRFQLAEKKALNKRLKQEILFNPGNKNGLPWWWLLLTGIGGFLIKKFLPSNKKDTD